jgi:hypothetical protein
VGPEKVVEGEGGARAVVSVFWTDEDGLCVNVDAGDVLWPAAMAEKVALELVRLSALRAPGSLELAAS